MDLLPWRNTDTDTKHDVWLMLIVHGLLLAAISIVFIIYTVTSVHYALETGRNPRFTTTVASFLHQLGFWSYSLFFVPVAFGWVDAYGYVKLSSRYGKKAAFLWATAGATVLMSFFAIVSAAAVMGIYE